MGLQYAIEPYGGGFLVTDGHHSRVLHVTRRGRVSVFRAFDNVVPTGLELFGPIVLMGQAGPLPHLPKDGKIVAFGPGTSKATTLGSGAPLIVDVEFGHGLRLYGLSRDVSHQEIPKGRRPESEHGRTRRAEMGWPVPRGRRQTESADIARVHRRHCLRRHARRRDLEDRGCWRGVHGNRAPAGVVESQFRTESSR